MIVGIRYFLICDLSFRTPTHSGNGMVLINFSGNSQHVYGYLSTGHLEYILYKHKVPW